MVLSDKLSEFFRVFRVFRGCKRIFNMAVYFLPLKHAFDTMPFQEIFNHGIHGPHGMLLSSGFHGFI
jgi:hypothetical protein